MKINKIIAIAAVAIMAVGAMGFMTTRTHAQSGATTSPQVQVTEAPDTQQAVSPDTDNVDEQVGDQNAQDTSVDNGNEAAETEDSNGVDKVPTGTPSITSDAALLAAQAYLNTTSSGTAVLDDENGMLVYSVEIDGKDVKVDAMTGTALGVDQVGDGQFEGGN